MGGNIMNNKSLLLILIIRTLSLQGEYQNLPVYIHHKQVKSESGSRVKLQNYTPRAIDVTYIPQQVVHVKNGPTKLPLARHTYSTGIQHLKCVLSSGRQKKGDRKTLELLVRKEPLNKTLAQLLDKEELLKGHKAVVRLYRKVTKDMDPTGKTCWKPILTLPETGSTHKLLEGIKVSPEGTIHLENS